MSLTIRKNGLDYTNWTSANVSMGIEQAAYGFTFVATADENEVIPIKGGELVEILADGILICTGYVDSPQVDHDFESHTITVTGRSLLADFIDSSVGTIKEFDGQVNLVDIIRSVLNGMGLSNIKIVNEAGTIKNFDASDITSAEIGQTGFDFCEKFARKRQVLITTNPSGGLVLARAGSNTSSVAIRHIKNDKGNNVISARFKDDQSERYNKYVAQSQGNPANLDAGTPPESIIDQVGVIYDPEIRASRVLEFYAEESSDSFTLKERAKWEANIRRARGKTYMAQIAGHTIDGEAFFPNVLHQIDDFKAGISSQLLTKQIVYEYSVDNGSITTIEFTSKNAYTLQVEADAREAMGDEF
jgi:prophage tail gpP-like protein